MVSAGNGDRARAGLSNYVSVGSANGGALIDAEASGIGTSHTQVSTQFFGISTNRADIVFGSVTAISCCGFDAGAAEDVDPGEYHGKRMKNERDQDLDEKLHGVLLLPRGHPIING